MASQHADTVGRRALVSWMVGLGLVGPGQALAMVAPGLAAEARLEQIIRLAAGGQLGEALAQARALVLDHPNFQLAQLTYGDLLRSRYAAASSSQAGLIPNRKDAHDTLAGLQDELRLRAQAWRDRPPQGALPTGLWALDPATRHAIAVDTRRARLYLFENSPGGIHLVADFYVSIGKLGSAKRAEGDHRTPLGVYHVTRSITAARLRDRFYGAGALPINYPNAYDVHRGRTGSGIWLHGTPDDQFARLPQATNGCVVLANPDLAYLMRHVTPGQTPVIVADGLTWATAGVLRAQRAGFDRALAAWRAAATRGSLSELAASYVTRTPQRAGQRIAPTSAAATQPPSIFMWMEDTEVVLTTSRLRPVQSNRAMVMRQYWVRRGDTWKIQLEQQAADTA